MEKLQAALKNARQKRSTAKGAALAIGGRQPRKAQESAWTDLPEVKLKDSALARHLVVTREASEQSTPFDILRTKILLQMRQNSWTRLAVTSPMPT